MSALEGCKAEYKLVTGSTITTFRRNCLQESLVDLDPVYTARWES